MAYDDRGPHVLAMDAALLAALLTAVLTDQSWLLAVALLLLVAIFWVQGAFRFRRTRRFFRELWSGVREDVRDRRPSRQTATRLGVVVGVVALLVLINRLRLSAPGEGRGLSFELSGLQLGFAGVNTPGDWLATIVTYLMLIALMAAVWWRIWLPVVEAASRMTVPYLVCLGVFLLIPGVFALLLWQAAPADPEQNAEFAQVAYKTTLSVMATALAAAIALPYGPWAKGRPEPTPRPGPVDSSSESRERLHVVGE